MSELLRELVLLLETIDWCEHCKYSETRHDDFPCNVCAAVRFLKFEPRGD